MELITEKTFRLKHVEKKTFQDLRFERCSFDNAFAKACNFRRVELIESRTWACSIHDTTLEDCLIDGVRDDHRPRKRRTAHPALSLG